MPTSTITNTTTAPDGSVIGFVPVTITLYGQVTSGPPSPIAGFRIDTGAEVVQIVNLTSNSSGVWSVGLERNSNITPANSFYVAQENFPVAQGGPKFWFFQVGALNQTLQAALVTVPPALLSSTFLTQAAGDARYVLAPGTFSGSVGSETIGAAGTAGVAASYSRGDHIHPNPAAAAPTASKPLDTSATGATGNYADAGHRHARESPASATVATSETTVSTAYTDLTTVGPSITITTSTFVLVMVGALTLNSVAGGADFMSFAVSGATTIAASDSQAFAFNSAVANEGSQACSFFVIAVNAGSNTFTAKYRVTANTGTWQYRQILVWPLN